MKISIFDWGKIIISFIFALVGLLRDIRKSKKKDDQSNCEDVTIAPALIPEKDPVKETTIKLKRTYFTNGTNGEIKANGKTYKTIELPWKDNNRRISCIEEGTYQIVKRHSERFKDHLHLLDVPGRDWILIHPANDAQAELAGCIALVEEHWDKGYGGMSANVTNEFRDYVYGLIDSGFDVYLKITH